MASNAILVNVACGPVLDSDVLLDALDDEELQAACIDVTAPEPLPADSPLGNRRDVLITLHTAGLSEKYVSCYLEQFNNQYDRWRSG